MTATTAHTRWASIKAYSEDERDETCRMVLELLQHLAQPTRPREPELDVVRAWCPPEARYSFRGRRP